jgi:prepilin-type N-terminal cleavage/methylation domain-containing protein
MENIDVHPLPPRFPVPVSRPTPCRCRRRRSAFTLAELLVVILILSIMSTLVIASLSGGGGSEDLNTSVSRLSKYFEYAQSNALTQKTTVRVGIHYDPADPERFLRYALIFYYDQDNDTWNLLDEGQFLPAGIFFSPGLSTPTQDTTPPLKRWQADMNWTTFTVTSFTGMVDLRTPYDASTGTDRALYSGDGKWLVYEFASNGTMTNPGQRLVLAEGIVNASNQLQIPNSDLADGFAVFRAGRPVHFQAPEQLKGM